MLKLAPNPKKLASVLAIFMPVTNSYKEVVRVPYIWFLI